MMDWWDDYESGPFCRHYDNPIDCDIVCATCGHGCVEHEVYVDTRCYECDCEEWVDGGDKR